MGSGFSGLNVLAPSPSGPFSPSIDDLRLATHLLSTCLPPELALLVLDYAQVQLHATLVPEVLTLVWRTQRVLA